MHICTHYHVLNQCNLLFSNCKQSFLYFNFPEIRFQTLYVGVVPFRKDKLMFYCL
jgi:hypothetical protein